MALAQGISLFRQRERRFIGLGGEEICVLSSIRLLLCAGVFLGSAIFEVFESKLASRVAYGVGARYLFISTEGKKIHRTVREENECQKPSEALIMLMPCLPSSCFLFRLPRLPSCAVEI